MNLIKKFVVLGGLILFGVLLGAALSSRVKEPELLLIQIPFWVFCFLAGYGFEWSD